MQVFKGFRCRWFSINNTLNIWQFTHAVTGNTINWLTLWKEQKKHKKTAATELCWVYSKQHKQYNTNGKFNISSHRRDCAQRQQVHRIKKKSVLQHNPALPKGQPCSQCGSSLAKIVGKNRATSAQRSTNKTRTKFHSRTPHNHNAAQTKP